jgi:hypothetical protein
MQEAAIGVGHGPRGARPNRSSEPADAAGNASGKVTDMRIDVHAHYWTGDLDRARAALN